MPITFSGCARAACLTVFSVIASSLLSRYASAYFHAFVGVTSPLFDNPPLYLHALRVGAIFLCGLSSANLLLLNPLFLVHLAESGFDCFFIAPLALCLDSNYPYIGALLISLIRQLAVAPDPSLSLLWLLDTHYLTAFRIPARFTIALFQATSFFLVRRSQSRILPVVLYAISDPCADWCSIALLTTLILPLLNTDPFINAAILMIASGFVFGHAAVYAWWTMGIGNANFVMVGSLIYTAGLICLLDHFLSGRSATESAVHDGHSA
jgi:hypothetical protein